MRLDPLQLAVASAIAFVPFAVSCRGGDELTGGSTSEGSTTSTSSSTATSSSSGTGGMGTGGAGGMGTGGGASASSGTGGMGTGGMGTGGMGTGGMAGECTIAMDCPATGNECTTAVCVAHQCETTMVAAGKPLAAQTPGNCHAEVCDGNGAITSAVDDTDVPTDGNACTNDVCTAGVASNPTVPSGTSCGGGLICNAAGACIGCNAPTDCPGMDTACQSRTCVAGACGLAFQPAGTVLATQVAGDCKSNQCNGAGLMVSVNDNNDTSSDNNACTSDTCGNGAPMHAPLAAGSACAQSGGTVCDGAGLCVECVTSATCSSGACVNNVCQTCTDGVKNGAETGVDCGGGACPSCAVGQPCLGAADCASGVCTVSACSPAGVLSTSPADGATSALETSPLAITFTGAMSPSSLTAQTTSGPCTGSIQASTDDFGTCIAFAAAAPAMSLGNTVATLVAAPGLSYGSTFKIRVTTAATDIAMSPLGAQYTSMTGFTTRLPTSACTGAGFVVVSQVYGGGGNVGAPLNKDFIELHNRGSAPVNITGWSVQYASAASSSWSKTALTGTIPAGGYFLVQEAGGAVGANLPTPDIATGTMAMAAGAGKIALVNDSTTLTTACPTGGTVVDLVGYGGTASCFEGTAPTATPSATLAVLRGGAGCSDQNQNGADFTASAPAPRNSASPAQVCTCGGDMTLNESGQPAEADYCAVQFPIAGITVQTGTATPIIYGRIFEAGVTPSAGAAPGITAEVGYGPASVNPEWQSGWQFFAATFNVQVGNDDEYQASFTAPAAGNYHYAYRFSQNGLDWTYCDVGGAGSNASLAFETTHLPALTVTP
jgi:Lamin Tail Domain/Bacterial Ig-like domain